MEKRIELPSEIKEAIYSDYFLKKNSEIKLKNRTYVLQEIIGDGFKSVVWKAVDDYGTLRAVKLAVLDDYKDRSYLSEAYLAKKLDQFSDLFAEFIDVDQIDLQISEDNKYTFVIFISKFIRGMNLREYLDKHKNDIYCNFLYFFVKKMCEALNALKICELAHDDLHAGNIMVETPSEATLDKETLKIKIIDTGSVKKLKTISKAVENGTRKEYKILDFDNFIDTVILILNHIVQNNRHRLKKFDKHFLGKTKEILDCMLDEGRKLDDPGHIFDSFVAAYDSCYIIKKGALPLNDAFDYISAEHIQDDTLLTALFSNKCPWWAKITSPDPVNLYGPRGCGKSTVFRMLRLMTVLHKDYKDIENQPLIGFDISCSADLRNRFALIDENKSRRFSKEIVHYFNLLLCYEITNTLKKISQRNDKALFGFNENIEKNFCLFIINHLNKSEDSLQRLTGIPPAEQLAHILQVAIDDTYKHILLGKQLSFATPPSFIAAITKYLQEYISFFANRQIAFLIDDLSKHRIPEHIQKILNLVIWDRQGSHVFKVSSEVRGAVYSDILDSTAEESREYQIIDCGTEYISLTDANMKAAKEFSTEILNRRLEQAGYTGKIEELIGDTNFKDGLTLSQALYRETEDTTYPRVYYHGLDIITNICSGDISTMLDVYRQIFKAAKIEKRQSHKIPENIQHTAITETSRLFFNKIKDYHPCGKRMYELVDRFGWLSRELLLRKIRKGGKREEPWSLIRIEAEMTEKFKRIEQNPEVMYLLNELVRRTIFIELNPGRSLRSNTTLRLQIRRIYCPHFKMALVHSAPLRITREEDFFYFLTDPQSFCENERAKRGPYSQLNLI